MGAQRGQSSVEYVALVALVAAVLGLGAALAATLGPGYRADGPITRPDPVAEAYGEPTAALVRRHAPAIVFERGLLDAPVDPRTCRVPACARGAAPVLFTHVVRRGATTYVQYWAYWPDSSWHGIAGHHADDWESLQLRIGADGRVDARASAHHGYTGGRIGPDLNLNQVRPDLVPERWRRGWTAWTGWWRVARHSHAGFVADGPGEQRTARGVRLVPLETARLPQAYAVTPPWRKAVYSDPESRAT